MTPGEKVRLVGFGVFDVYRRKPRLGRDPYAGTPIIIPECAALRSAHDFTKRVAPG